jgi:hypothetical protein
MPAAMRLDVHTRMVMASSLRVSGGGHRPKKIIR